jgi:lysophospholipid acyltransferase (LPLAT)-like uncharacterized protein
VEAFEPTVSASWLERLSAAIMVGYMRLCLATSRWQIEGADALGAAMRRGPVVLVYWHSRLIMASITLPPERDRLITLFARNRDGRIGGGVQKRLGMLPFGVDGRASNLAASRAILRLVQSGKSLALPADGYKGPARILQDAPLEWAQATGCEVWVAANSTRRQWRLPGWDRMLVPLPFTRGAVVLRKWDGTVPRRADQDQFERLRQSLSETLDRAASDADAAVGRAPGP